MPVPRPEKSSHPLTVAIPLGMPGLGSGQNQDSTCQWRCLQSPQPPKPTCRVLAAEHVALPPGAILWAREEGVLCCQALGAEIEGQQQRVQHSQPLPGTPKTPATRGLAVTAPLLVSILTLCQCQGPGTRVPSLSIFLTSLVCRCVVRVPWVPNHCLHNTPVITAATGPGSL